MRISHILTISFLFLFLALPIKAFSPIKDFDIYSNNIVNRDYVRLSDELTIKFSTPLNVKIKKILVWGELANVTKNLTSDAVNYEIKLPITMAPKSQDIVLDFAPDMNLAVYQLTINSNIIFTDSSIIPKIGRINLESSNPLNKYVALINDTVTLKFETLDTSLLVSKVLIGNQEIPFNRIINGNLVSYSASIKAQDLAKSGKLNYTIISNSSTISSDTSKRTVEVIKNMKDLFSTISFFDKNNVKITKTNTNLLEAKILMELTSDHYALINDLKQNNNSILKSSCQNKSCKFESDIKVLNINEPLEIQGSLLNTISIFPVQISDYIEAPVTKDPVKPTSPQINSRADLTYLQNNFSSISMAGRFPAVLTIEGLKDVGESVRQSYISSQGLTLLNLTNNLVIKELDFNYSLSNAELSIDLGSLMNIRLNSEDIPRIISSSKLKNSLILRLNNFKKAKIYILNPDGTYNKIPKKDLIIMANKIKVKQSSISSEALYLIIVSPYGNDFIKLK
jgi:hypothetical protein